MDTSGAPAAPRLLPALPHGAGGAATSSANSGFPRPLRVIAIRDHNLADSYIDELLHGKGLKGPQVARIRLILRRYIDSFIAGRGIELDDGAYALLTNMLIHLIEESSKDR